MQVSKLTLDFWRVKGYNSRILDLRKRIRFVQTNTQTNATNAKNSRTVAWAMLIAAIALEICGLSILKALDNAGKGTIGKVALVILMNLSYFLMSLTLRQIAVGVAYATWEIVGGIGVLLVSFVFFEPHLSTAQYFGIALGFSGIVCIILGEEHSKNGSSSQDAKAIHDKAKAQ